MTVFVCLCLTTAVHYVDFVESSSLVKDHDAYRSRVAPLKHRQETLGWMCATLKQESLIFC